MNVRIVLGTKGQIRLFYAVEDDYPPWRVDLVELFGRELAGRDVTVEWGFQRRLPGGSLRAVVNGQMTNVPPGFGRGGRLARFASHVLARLHDVFLFRLWLTGERFDILQVRDRRYDAAVLAWLAARLRGLRFVYWLSFPFADDWREKARLRTGLARRIAILRAVVSERLVYGFLMQRADYVFVQSECMLDDAVRRGVRREKLTSIPMGAVAALTSLGDGPRVPSVRGLIVYLGTFAGMRRLELLLDAFALVRRTVPFATLAMVGEGDVSDERRALEERAADLGISESVTFTGFLPHPQAWDWVARAELCVSPLYPVRVLEMGSSTKVVEYLALGKPVVVTHHPEQTQVVRESGAGVSVECTAEAMTAAIVDILNNPERAAAMGARGPAWIRKHRAYDVLADQVAAVYQQILSAS